jgi:hypothetical protein
MTTISTVCAKQEKNRMRRLETSKNQEQKFSKLPKTVSQST